MRFHFICLYIWFGCEYVGSVRGVNIFHGNDEFNKNDLNFNVTEDTQLSERLIDDFPDYFDWRDKSMVSPVKDQRSCPACWAFAAVANVESHLKIHRGVEETLSEQFLIDCDNTTQGCAPASLLKTFGNIITNFGGILRDGDYYPYSEQREKCRWRSGVDPVPVIGMKRVFPDEAAMAHALVQSGPLAAAINPKSMYIYKGNYIDEPSDTDCPPGELDHTVLIVGYNTYIPKDGKAVPYWIIKNSWGTHWGDGGFYYLVRGRNACGIATDVSYAIVD